MAMTIGIFDRESDVAEAIRLLREAGLEQGDIRVVVKNAESARWLVSETDVPIEELTAIRAAGQKESAADGIESDTIVLPAAIMGTTTGTFGYGYVGGAAAYGTIVGGLDGDDEVRTTEILRNIGVSDEAAGQCGVALNEGSYLLLAESGEEAQAEQLLRHAGAKDIRS
ncbi:general stress protein [Cohnella faecalis]|uniref:Uncharacterized protein n=1 Tax=Cohnella faecalis TaxID=2315694 RepID=A0A398CIQ2_9BACL|nr:general stress protein [Cohnella faecalis]RIE02613.1 hypothetical protein D3H35_18190 [Cohnella faecalis]